MKGEGKKGYAGFISGFPAAALNEHWTEKCKKNERKKGQADPPTWILLSHPLLLRDTTLANLHGVKTSLRVKRLSEQGLLD